MNNQDQLIEIFQKTGALLEGHFILTSGRHSPTYFQCAKVLQYPEYLQKLRIQFKPGLVPPYYADLPDSFEEVVESERLYLKKKQKNIIITDIQYFFRAIYNIIFKGARSK